MHSLYRSSTRGPEDDSVESKHVTPLSYYMFNFTTVVFDGTSPAFYIFGLMLFMNQWFRMLYNVSSQRSQVIYIVYHAVMLNRHSL